VKTSKFGLPPYRSATFAQWPKFPPRIFKRLRVRPDAAYRSWKLSPHRTRPLIRQNLSLKIGSRISCILQYYSPHDASHATLVDDRLGKLRDPFPSQIPAPLGRILKTPELMWYYEIQGNRASRTDLKGCSEELNTARRYINTAIRNASSYIFAWDFSIQVSVHSEHVLSWHSTVYSGAHILGLTRLAQISSISRVDLLVYLILISASDQPCSLL